YVHRDLRFANIVIGPSSEGYLIDFGTAVKISQDLVEFKGSLYTASQRILSFVSDDLNEHVYQPADDIESFLKLFLHYEDPDLEIPSTKRSLALAAKDLFDFWAGHQ